MTGLDADLATLREFLSDYDDTPLRVRSAFLRVEAEITRLRERGDDLERNVHDNFVSAEGWRKQAKAAERELAAMSRRNEWLAAKVARLQEGLRQIAERERWVQASPLIDEARALLAEDGAPQPDDTPFTAPDVQSHERGLFERRKDGATDA